ncbi:cell envelope integrity protein CreD [bacterium]|nr:cell envelope integrity protein CreD [bacterium]
MSDAPTTPTPRPGGGLDLSRFTPQGSLGLKLLLVCGLAALMTIPVGFIFALIYMRSGEASSAVAEVAARQGGEQVVLGPVITVPYELDTLDAEKKAITITGRVVLFAETGSLDARLTGERLRIGLHDVPVYSSETQVTADFDLSRLAPEAPSGARLLWPQARVVLSLSDLRGAKSVDMTLGGRTLEFAPTDGGAGAPGGMPLTYQQLVAAPAPWLESAAGGALAAQGRIVVTGAQRLAFAAFAKDTAIRMSGDWADPSFDGAATPESRNVTETGFEADWAIPFLARGEPGAGRDLSVDNLIGKSVGATLLDAGNPYRSVERALKYAPMFFGLVFLTYFLFEVATGAKAHPAQYLLVGLAQAVFYLLLLSTSELIGFMWGFIVAAGATVAMLSLYAGSVFRSQGAMLQAFAVFAALYGLIYVLMTLEDYALLVGSIACLLAIAATMWLTRNVDWYGERRNESAA